MLLQLVSDEEVKKMKLKPLGKRHFVRVAIEKLEVGQQLRISTEAFTWKGHTPAIFCNAIAKSSNKRFEISKLTSNTAWIVKRIA